MAIPLRGIYGHSVHLRIRFETFLEVVCFCQKLAQIVLRDDKYEFLHVVFYANYEHKNRAMPFYNLKQLSLCAATDTF